METIIDLDQLTSLLTAYAPKVIGAILTLIIGFWIAGWISRRLQRTLKARDVDENVRPFIGSLVSVGLKVLVLLSVASMFGIETTSFVAIFSALAFAIGLALQGTLSHFAAGVMILVFKPYRKGDFVSAAGYSGTVKEIQVFNTVLSTLDNRDIIIPNGTAIGSPIENFTKPGERRLDLTFGAGYEDDIDKVKSVLDGLVKECPGVKHDKGVQIMVKELGDSTVNYGVRFWTEGADYWPAFFFMQENVKRAFDREGLNIPYPQMDVHVNQ